MESQPTPPQSYVTPQVVNEAARGPIRVVIERTPGSWFGSIVRWVLLVVLVLVVASLFVPDDTKLEEEWHSLSKTATNKIAIISIEGTIIGQEGYVKDQIDQVRGDEDVKAVIVRVDSPGGTVTASDYFYHHLKKLGEEEQLPLVVSMGGIAASGGYYVAMAVGETEDTIFAEPTTWTGSIGVIIPHYDISKLLKKWEIEDDSIASNPLKMMGSPTRDFPEPIAEEERKILEGLVESSFNGFKDIVLASRPALREDKGKQDVVFTGRIFTSEQAKENLLVDKIGFVEDAVERAAELANLDESDVQVVRYKRPVGALDMFLFGQSQAAARPNFDLGALVDLTVPRAYYLWTSMPGLARMASP